MATTYDEDQQALYYGLPPAIVATNSDDDIEQVYYHVENDAIAYSEWESRYAVYRQQFATAMNLATERNARGADNDARSLGTMSQLQWNERYSGQRAEPDQQAQQQPGADECCSDIVHFHPQAEDEQQEIVYFHSQPQEQGFWATQWGVGY
eukprot:m.488781 g.488781  ORF g.488781 m.488781 type:complete len:151 (+) comp26082_c0_seq1:212-664(+)